MAVRLFTCRHCGHHLRLGSPSCGNCGAAAPMINVTLVFIAFFVLAALLAVAGTAILAN